MPKIKSIRGEREGQEWTIGASPILAGRRESNAIVITHSKASRTHAEFILQDGAARIRDLQSSNGTFLNGIRLQAGASRVLRPGDEVRIGATTLRFFEADAGIPAVQIPGHEIEEVIAEGGMGVIYRARQVSMDRSVAIKILHPRYAKRNEFVQRFIQEARSAGKLNHPNIIQVHNVGKAGDDCYYFSMELVQGATLTQRLGQREGLSLETILQAGARIADALEYAHQRGIIHRDVKPDNIILADSGEVKLADLGIAKTTDALEETGDGRRILGTPHYMSPEQASGDPLDGRSDLYSLGATLYHAIAGVPVFDHPDSGELMNLHLGAPSRPLAEAAPEIPASICAVIDRLLAKKPADRFPTAAEARDALDATLEAARRAPSPSARPAARPAGEEAADPSEEGEGLRTKSARGKKPLTPVQLGGLIGGGALALILTIVALLGGGGKGPAQGADPKPVAGPAKKKQSPAATAFADALALEQAGKLAEARDKFRLLLVDFGGNPEIAEESKRRLEDIGKKIDIEERTRQVAEAWDRYLELAKRSPDAADTLRGRLAELTKEFPELREKTKAETAQLDAAAARQAEAARKSLAETVDRLLGQKNIDGALAEIEKVRGEQGEIEGLAALQEKTRAAGATLIAEMAKKVGEIRTAKQYGKALLQISSCRKEIRFAPLGEEAGRLEQELLADVEQTLGPTEKKIRALIARREFEQASIEIGGPRLLCLGTPLQARIDELVSLLEGLKTLHGRMEEIISAAQPWIVPKETGIKKLEGRTVTGAAPEGLKVTMGPARYTLKWSDLAPAEIVTIYQRYLPPGDEALKKELQRLAEFPSP